MRRDFSILSALLLTALCLPSKVTATAVDIPKCNLTATHAYSKNKCAIEVNREEPGSPLPVQVPNGTTVIVRVVKPRAQESLKVSTTTDQIAVPDVAQALLKQILDPLKSLVASEGRNLWTTTITDPILDEQTRVERDLKKTVDLINIATSRLTCLQSYTEFKTQKNDQKKAVYSCGTEALKAADFIVAKNDALNAIDNAALPELPVGRISGIDAELKTKQDTCNGTTLKKTERDACLVLLDTLQSNQIRLKDSSTNLQTGRKTLLQAAEVLTNLPVIADPFEYQVARPPNRKATIKIAGISALDKTSTDIATVVITWQQSNWALSTGILFSTLANQTFANSTIIVNGVPSTDGSGKYLTRVTVDSIKPSIVFPAVFGSYRLGTPPHCNGKCSVLVSGGVGANLTSKTTDFGGGISVQLGSILLTPLAHFGRQTELAGGVHVGDKLGSNPPTLPTQTNWKTSFGFGISYRLPIP
jgi:hypothetical protein